MHYHFQPLMEEAQLPEFKTWHNLLHHLVTMHEGAMYQNQNSPAPYPLETLGAGYYFNPAFGHWDLIYTLLDSCPVMPEHTLQQLENMLTFQQEDGFMAGAIFFRSAPPEMPNPDWYSSFPPVWPLAVDEYTKYAKDDKAVKLCYQPLLKQIKWFEKNRKADNYGFFFKDMIEPRNWESGVDESIRCEVVQERGKFPNIDATSLVRLLYDSAARWSEMLGLDNTEFVRKRDELDQALQTHFFCDETGFFHDAYLLDRNIKYRALTAVWALTCGAATEEQANRMIDGSLLNPEYFFTAHPLPFVAINEPYFKLKMWRGGSWNSLTWMAVLGCLRYNRRDAALKIAERVLKYSQINYYRTGAIWEFYHPYGEAPLEMARKHAPWLLPCREYLGHNPLFAYARLLAGK